MNQPIRSRHGAPIVEPSNRRQKMNKRRRDHDFSSIFVTFSSPASSQLQLVQLLSIFAPFRAPDWPSFYSTRFSGQSFISRPCLVVSSPSSINCVFCPLLHPLFFYSFPFPINPLPLIAFLVIIYLLFIFFSSFILFLFLS